MTITGTAGTVFYRTPSATLYGIDLSDFTTEMNGYVNYTYPNCIVECLDYNGVSGAYKGWTRGGLAVSQTSVMPERIQLGILDNPSYNQRDSSVFQSILYSPCWRIALNRSAIAQVRIYDLFAKGVFIV